MAERVLPYEVNCSHPVHRAAAAAAAGRGEGGRLRRGRVLVAVRRGGARRRARSTSSSRAVADAGVRLIGLNFFAGDMPGGDRGLVSWPARSAEFRDNIDVTVGIGDRLGGRAFNALYGNRVEGARPGGAGRPGGREPGAGRRGRRPDRRHGAGRAGQRRRPLPAEDRRRRRRGDRPGRGRDRRRQLGFLCDLYHLAVNGDDVDRGRSPPTPTGSRTCRSPTRPGRGEPGTGKLDLDRLPRRLAPPATTAGSAWSTSPAGPAPPGFAWLPRAAPRHAPPQEEGTA